MSADTADTGRLSPFMYHLYLTRYSFYFFIVLLQAVVEYSALDLFFPAGYFSVDPYFEFIISNPFTYFQFIILIVILLYFEFMRSS